MCPPAAAPLVDIDYHCTSEQLIKHLDKLQRGFPLPGNVLTGVNPYRKRPENLRDGFWYLIHSEESKGTEDGIWKPKGEACCVFKDKSITGWRTTLEFFEAQAPHSQKKTDWIMHVFKITSNDLGKNIHVSEVQEDSMLCKVFLSSADLTDQDRLLANHGVDSSCEKRLQSNPLGLVNTESRFEKGSTSNHQENNESNEGISDSPPTGPVAENVLENDFILAGDYIEEWDLVAPGSRTSSSDNSSGISVLSDECFDSLALLQDLEPRICPDPESRDRSDRIITGTAASGSLSIQEPTNAPSQGTSRTDLPSTSSATGREKKRECSNGNPSPSSREVTPSSSRQSSDSEESKKGNGRIKRPKKKYLCFLPF